MARNKVQFQKGLSEAQFAILYGTEDQCREAVMRWRWPSGFVCPVCAGEHHSFVKTRALYQCTACRRQTSVIAGTIFAATKVPLCTWFRAMYHLTQSKGGISSIELGRRLGVTQTTAWNPAFKWVNTTLGNIKSAITGPYRAIRDKHAPRYLAEFEYRFNRRYDLAAMMPRLGYVAVRTPPMPYRLLKLAEDHA